MACPYIVCDDAGHVQIARIHRTRETAQWAEPVLWHCRVGAEGWGVGGGGGGGGGGVGGNQGLQLPW